MNVMVAKTVIFICAADRLPLTVDAIIEEQDTCLLLGREPAIRETQESYPELVRKMEQQKLLMQGQVLVKNTVPLRLTAVVYDIEQNPVCSEESIVVVLGNLLEKFDEYRMHSVAMPLLGHAHGRIKISRFIHLLLDALKNRNTTCPAEIFLIASPNEVDDVSDIIVNFMNQSERL